MKKVAFFIVIVFLLTASSVSYAKSWWQKIIERMMSEGIVRVDNGFDDSMAARMAYDAYVIAPKAFSAGINFANFNLFPKAEDKDVTEDVKKGKYGPVSFNKDASDVVLKGDSMSGRKAIMHEKANEYKLDAQARISAYIERAKKIKEEVSYWTNFDIDGISGKSLEVTSGVMSEKMETMADNIALRLYMSEMLALRTALTGEIAILGTVEYANFLSDSLNGSMEIYDLVKVR